MGFGDTLKQAGDQLQQLVGSNKDKIQGAVGSVGSAADKATKGKYSDTIAKAGEKANAAVDKIAPDDAQADPPAAAADGAEQPEGEVKRAERDFDGP